jgi:hypothetical protein
MADNVTEFIVETVKRVNGAQPGIGKAFVREMRQSGKLQPRSNGTNGLHLTKLAKACFGDAWEARLRYVSERKAWAKEGAEGVDLSAFNDITGAVLVEAVEVGHTQAVTVADQLCGVWQSGENPMDEATIPEFGVSPDEAMDVPAGQAYPRAGFQQIWVKAPRPNKFGLIAALTLEVVKANQVSQFLDAAEEVGRVVGTEEAERKIKVAIGATNNYNRLGSQTNTYLTSGAYANSLTDFVIANGPAEVDRLFQLSAAMTHPVTGKNITFTPTGVLTVPGNMFSARQVFNATEYRTPNSTTAVSIAAGNPLGVNFQPMADPHVQRIAALGAASGGLGLTAAKAKTLLIIADFQRAFKWRQVEPFSVFETGDLSNDSWPPSFFEDVVYAVKARSWGCAFVREPRFAYRGYNNSAS